MQEITSFNGLFSMATIKGFKLNAFDQDRDGNFHANWRIDATRERAAWFGESVVHNRPFDAARDAFVAALAASPYHQEAQVADAVKDLFT
ncbi:MAG: hypothetical protein KGL39_05130 [Patescibacteria group bacterium]|nr:hypothetical protein [Patescibacteria group bacterium]